MYAKQSALKRFGYIKVSMRCVTSCLRVLPRKQVLRSRLISRFVRELGELLYLEFGLRQSRRSWDSPNDKATIILWYRITCVLFLFTIFPFYRDLHVATTALFMAAAPRRAAHVPRPIWKNPFPYCTCAWLRIAWSRFRLHTSCLFIFIYRHGCYALVPQFRSFLPQVKRAFAAYLDGNPDRSDDYRNYTFFTIVSLDNLRSVQI